MKITRNQFKLAVKSIVRECLNERTEKKDRQLKHIEDSERKLHPNWSEKKLKSIAYGAVANQEKGKKKGKKKSKQNEDFDVGMANAKNDDTGKITKLSNSKIDSIIKVILSKYPGISNKPEKMAKLAVLLYQHMQYRFKKSPQSLSMKMRNDPFRKEPVGNDFAGGEPSQNGEEPEKDFAGGEPEAEEEPEKSFSGKEGQSEEEESSSNSSEEEGKNEEEESKSKEEESVEESTQTMPPRKGSYKVVAPHAYTDEEENEALNIQGDPEVNEAANNNTLPPNKGQYKVAPPHLYTTAQQNIALTGQTDPKRMYEKTDMRLSSLLEKKKKKMKENHKVQNRSYATANDWAGDPNNVRDPKVPGP